MKVTNPWYIFPYSVFLTMTYHQRHTPKKKYIDILPFTIVVLLPHIHFKTFPVATEKTIKNSHCRRLPYFAYFQIPETHQEDKTNIVILFLDPSVNRVFRKRLTILDFGIFTFLRILAIFSRAIMELNTFERKFN